VKRREFITLIGGATAWPLAARAQQATMPVIGFLNGQSAERFVPYLAAFQQGLKDTGYIEGQNVTIEYRWANGKLDQLPAMAADLVKRQVNVIAWTGGGQSPSAIKAATTTIPIVTLFGGDPVKFGFVHSLNRPDGNLTGVVLFAYSLGPKRLQMLRELLPDAKSITMLVNRDNPDPESKDDAQQTEAAARSVGLKLNHLNISSDREIDSAFAILRERKDDALLVMGDPFFNSRREQLVALAARTEIPAIFEWREFAVVGGLMSYGASITDAYRQAGIYTGKILNGAKPADLPVMQAVKVELVINLKTAKALGLTFPITLLGRADEAIE
jgi:putative ABC transport system substrate-binding protein